MLHYTCIRFRQLFSNCGSGTHQWVVTQIFVAQETDKTDEAMRIKGLNKLLLWGGALLPKVQSYISLSAGQVLLQTCHKARLHRC